MKIDYPTLEEVLEIHRSLIEQFGGAAGIRDMGALESSLMRPQLGYYDSLVEQAAALMESLANNHPFVDGNKRVSFFVTDTFLRLNGQFIEADSDKAYAHFMKLFSESSFVYAELLLWLNNNISDI